MSSSTVDNHAFILILNCSQYIRVLIFCFVQPVTFSGGEEHLPQMPHPRLGILLIIIA